MIKKEKKKTNLKGEGNKGRQDGEGKRVKENSVDLRTALEELRGSLDDGGLSLEESRGDVLLENGRLSLGRLLARLKMDREEREEKAEEDTEGHC